MNTTYTILTTMENVSMVCDTYGIMYAMVDGKLYDAYNGKPVNHGGRQLRENSRNLIDAMRSEAFGIKETLKAEREAERQNAISVAVEKALAEKAQEAPQKAPEAPQGLGMLESLLMDTVAKYATEKALDDILPAVREKVIKEFGAVPVKHEIIIPDRPKRESTEIFHEKFDKMLSMLLDGESFYLCGPAGTGKSFVAKQLADALGLPYYSANSVTDEVTIKGFIDAGGNYHETEFYKAFTGGGVFLLDELDASIPEVLVMLNEALANGYFPFPTGRVKAHADFHCIAAGNTFGTGSDSQYTGRMVIDASSLDRFALLKTDYSENIEINMANGDKDLVNFAHDFRRVVNNAGIHCLFTYRGIKRLAKFTAYMDKSEAIEIGLTKGLDKSDLTVIAKSLNGNNEWIKAFKQLAEV